MYSNFSREIQELGSIDIVLADGGVLLLTNYDEQEKIIRNGLVTRNPKLIAAATRLFARLEDMAASYALTSN